MNDDDKPPLRHMSDGAVAHYRTLMAALRAEKTLGVSPLHVATVAMDLAAVEDEGDQGILFARAQKGLGDLGLTPVSRKRVQREIAKP